MLITCCSIVIKENVFFVLYKQLNFINEDIIRLKISVIEH